MRFVSVFYGTKPSPLPSLELIPERPDKRATAATAAELSSVSRKPAQLRKKTLRALPHSVCGSAIQLRDLFPSVSIEFNLHEEVQFRIAEETVRCATIEKMSERCESFHPSVVVPLNSDSKVFRPDRAMHRSFAACPFEKSPLQEARNREDDMRLA